MKSLSIGSALAALLLLANSSFASELMVHNAWIRAMPPGSRVVPVYLTLHNGGDTALVLSRITSPRGEIALHQTVQEGEMMKMLPVASIQIPAHGMVTLEPQGYHGMMSDFSDGVPQKGDEVALELTLANGEVLKAKARVTMDGPEHNMAQHNMTDHSMHH